MQYYCSLRLLKIATCFFNPVDSQLMLVLELQYNLVTNEVLHCIVEGITQKQ